MSSLKSKSYLLQVLSPPCKPIQDSKITLTDETIGCNQVSTSIVCSWTHLHSKTIQWQWQWKTLVQWRQSQLERYSMDVKQAVVMCRLVKWEKRLGNLLLLDMTSGFVFTSTHMYRWCFILSFCHVIKYLLVVLLVHVKCYISGCFLELCTTKESLTVFMYGVTLLWVCYRWKQTSVCDQLQFT